MTFPPYEANNKNNDNQPAQGPFLAFVSSRLSGPGCWQRGNPLRDDPLNAIKRCAEKIHIFIFINPSLCVRRIPCNCCNFQFFFPSSFARVALLLLFLLLWRSLAFLRPTNNLVAHHHPLDSRPIHHLVIVGALCLCSSSVNELERAGNLHSLALMQIPLTVVSRSSLSIVALAF